MFTHMLSQADIAAQACTAKSCCSWLPCVAMYICAHAYSDATTYSGSRRQDSLNAAARQRDMKRKKDEHRERQTIGWTDKQTGRQTERAKCYKNEF